MKLITAAATVVLAFVLSDTADAARNKDATCKEIDRKIERIYARMRQGYTAKQGVRLQERLRELQDRRYELCR